MDVATTAGVVQPLVAVVTMMLSLATCLEKPNWLKLVGLLLYEFFCYHRMTWNRAIGGALIVLKVEQLTIDNESFWGPLLIIASYFCYSTYLVIQKPLTKRIAPITVLAWALTIGGIVLS